MNVMKISIAILIVMFIGCSSSFQIPKTESGDKPELMIFIIKETRSSMSNQHMDRLSQIEKYVNHILDRDASKYGFNVSKASLISDCDTKKTYCLVVRINNYIPVDRSNSAGDYFEELSTAPAYKRQMRYNGSMTEGDNLQKHEKATLDLIFELKNNYEINVKDFKYPFIMQDLNWKQCVIRSSSAFFDEYFTVNKR